jgi:hypothetical protein
MVISQPPYRLTFVHPPFLICRFLEEGLDICMGIGPAELGTAQVSLVCQFPHI